MPRSTRFLINACIGTLVVATAIAAVVLTLHVTRELPEVQLARGAMVAGAILAVSALTVSGTHVLIHAGLSRLYAPGNKTQRWVIKTESSALSGLAGGLAGGSLLYSFTRTWLPVAIPPEDLFMLLPLAATAFSIGSGQIGFWVQEASAGEEDANRQLNARARQLEHEAEVREKFLLTMAHESRTPLTSLRVSSELLRDVSTKNDDPVISRLSQNIGRSAGELASLYASIVDIGRIMKQDFSLKPETVSLSEIVNGVSGAVTPAITSKKQRLTVTNGAELVEVIADRQGVNRILVSILENASKYSPSESEIEVIVSADGKHVVFEVKDHGEGIAPEEQEKIFQPFYRVKSADAQHGAGIGIGLAVAKALAEAHGGSISVNSAPGQGSSFTVSLPVNGSSDAQHE